MPENQPANSPTETPSASATAGSSTAPTEFKFPDGRSAADVLGDLVAMKDQMAQLAEQNRRQAEVLQRFNQPVAPPNPLEGLRDDDIVTAAQVRQLQEQAAKTYVTPALQRAYEQMASQSVGIARQQFAKEFQKYGPEIQAELAKLPADAKTLDNIGMVVDLVRGRHVDELARELAAQFATEVPTMRSNGAAGSGTVPSTQLGLQSDDLPPKWKEQALAMGLTEEALDDFCRSNNMTRAQFFADMKKMKERGWDSAGLSPIIGEGGRIKGQSFQGAV